MAEASGSTAGRKATSLTREQLARREALDLVLKYHAEFFKEAAYRDLTLEQRAERVSEYIIHGEQGVAPG